MLDALKQILSNNTIKRVEEYEWKGRQYLRVFVVGQMEPVWDGPKTHEASNLISAKHNWKLWRKKKGTR
jgi:hypothetical protein